MMGRLKLRFWGVYQVWRDLPEEAQLRGLYCFAENHVTHDKRGLSLPGVRHLLVSG